MATRFFQESLTDIAHRAFQIGQLLASITGEKSTTPASSSQISRSSNGIPVKRKADEDSKAFNLKAPRIGSTPNGATNSTSDVPKAPRPYTGSARPSSTNTSRPLNDKPLSSAPRKPSPFTDGRPSPTSVSFSNASRPGTPASAPSLAKRPAPPAAYQSATSATSDSAKAPKKGSIAEIRARAAAQQNKLQAIGKLQHKSTEKQLTKKEREEAAAEEAKASRKGLKPSNRSGAGALPSRSGLNGIQRNGNGHLDRARGAIQKPTTGKSGKAPVVEERKVKKAALATTGYQGSARPVVTKAKSSSVRPGAPGAARDRGRDKPNPMGMFSKPRRQRDDDYDEDMDDFVVDDEEEEEEEGPGYGSRYKYADEDSESDMEAGYSDLDAEEAAAAKAARLEDIREERLLEQRKREKEARKRALLQGKP